MAQKPKGTRTVNVFNPGVDKRIPTGFVDVVIDSSGDWVGFVRQGKFYKLGEKAAKTTTPQVENPGLSADQIDDRIDPQNAKEYVNNPDPTIAHNARTIQYLISTGQMAADGSARSQTVDTSKIGQIVPNPGQKAPTNTFAVTKNTQQKSEYERKLAANQKQQADNAKNGTKYPLPYPNLTPPAGSKTTTTTASQQAQQDSETARENRRAGLTPAPAALTPQTPPKTTGTGNGGGGGGGGNGSGNKLTQAEKNQRTNTAEINAMEYFIPDSIFKNDPQLQKILTDFVNGVTTESTFKRQLATSAFVAQYSQTARQRLLQSEQYDRLKAEGRDVSNTPLAQELTGIVGTLKSYAKEMGSLLTDAEFTDLAMKLWKTNQESNDYAIRSGLRQYIKVAKDATGASTLTGKAGINYRDILSTLTNNGFNEDMAPAIFGGKTMDAVLQDIAAGENPKTYMQMIRNTAALGYGDSVRNLLLQGVDLNAIADPYIQAMAATLEINPSTITINDNLIRGAMAGDATLNLYDFTKALRKDERWQYTKQARDDVYGSVLQVLRDFGFTG